MSMSVSGSELEFIRRYVSRNPYTGGFYLDVEGASKDPALRAFLASVWADGYDSGADDIILDHTIEQAYQNPYK